MERAAALTGFAVRPMIASGYEKAGRRWGNSLPPNVRQQFVLSGHFDLGGVGLLEWMRLRREVHLVCKSRPVFRAADWWIPVLAL